MIERDDIILRLILDPKCSSSVKGNVGEFKKGNMRVVCNKLLYRKIMKFAALKNYKMVSQLIDMYSNTMQTNFE